MGSYVPSSAITGITKHDRRKLAAGLCNILPRLPVLAAGVCERICWMVPRDSLWSQAE
jgi:hypothetical protein